MDARLLIERSIEPTASSRAADMLEEQALDQASRLSRVLRADHPGLLEAHPVEEYLSWFDAMAPGLSYPSTPERARVVARDIERDLGEPALSLYNQLALCHAASSIGERCRVAAIPEEIEQRTREFVAGVVSAMETRPGGTYRMEVDRFAKEFAAARVKLVCCGPEFVDLSGGVPQRSLLHRPYRHVARRLAFMLLRSRGFSPFLESHLDRRLVREFNPAGYDAFYHRLALLLNAHPNIKGYVGSGAWFCDPALSAVSPELSYLVDVPVGNGAVLFPLQVSEVATRDALRMSPVRRAAFDGGRYIPRPYVLVWPRKSLIAWSKRHGG